MISGPLSYRVFRETGPWSEKRSTIKKEGKEDQYNYDIRLANEVNTYM